MSRRELSIERLVQGFAENLSHLRAPGYKESEARLQYIDPFWQLLGWDVENRAQLPPQDVEVRIERSMDSAEGLRSREPDYLFRVGGFPRFIVEAKKPAIDIDDDRDAIFQAKRYAWSAAIPFAVLTNFQQFRLFDTTLKPIHTEPSRGLVEEFRLDFAQYVAQWDVLAKTFGRDAVAEGSLERLRATIRRVRPGRRLRTVDRMLIDLKGDEPIDRVFLEHLERFRAHFAREIYRENKREFPDADTLHGAARLTEAVQRLIDRIVFMRVCEDREIAEWGSLRAVLDRISTEGGNLYEAVCAEFRRLDREYNGYLFKHHFVETLTVPEHVLGDFIRTLYPPEGPWDFRKVADDILGIIYERFLGSVVAVRQRQVVVEQKPEVRHAGGVYYTPRFVVDTIIRRVVGPKVKGRSPLDLLDLKVLDPACGSGSFLVAAFQFLVDHCVAAITADPNLATVAASPKARRKKKDIAFRDREGQWHIAPDFKAAILTSCIHGVDIDQQAVEVTVMSLYLKMLEGKLPPNWQRDWLERQLLPPLDNNIHCGNSLIDSTDFDRWCEEVNGTLFPLDDDDVRFRINRFDWTSRTRGFGRILDAAAVGERRRAGFDCIIGNPPYIRVQELNKWAPEECEFYKWRYESAAQGNYDIYVAFTEKALSLLAPEALLSFIMPHKFWQAKYGRGLRKLIGEAKALDSIIDFTHEQVFRGASVYTAIHVLRRRSGPAKDVRFARVHCLEDGHAQCVAMDAGKEPDGTEVFAVSHPTGVDPWLFVPAARRKRVDALSKATEFRLRDIAARMAQGIRTSANPIFVVRREGKLFYSEAKKRAIELEPTFLHPFLPAESIRRYEIQSAQDYVLIPYKVDHYGRAHLVDSTEIADRAPNTWKYLRSVESQLRAREHGRMDHDRWYGFVYPKNLSLIGEPKILVPDIIEQPAFCLDRKGEYAYVSGYGIVLKPEFSHYFEYLLGLLNSSLLGEHLKRISTPLRGGWFRPFPLFMGRLPIKLPQGRQESKSSERIAESVHEIIEMKPKLRNQRLSDRERTQLGRSIEALERRIDEAVLALYGLDDVSA